MGAVCSVLEWWFELTDYGLLNSFKLLVNFCTPGFVPTLPFAPALHHCSACNKTLNMFNHVLSRKHVARLLLLVIGFQNIISRCNLKWKVVVVDKDLCRLWHTADQNVARPSVDLEKNICKDIKIKIVLMRRTVPSESQHISQRAERKGWSKWEGLFDLLGFLELGKYQNRMASCFCFISLKTHKWDLYRFDDKKKKKSTACITLQEGEHVANSNWMTVTGHKNHWQAVTLLLWSCYQARQNANNSSCTIWKPDHLFHI